MSRFFFQYSVFFGRREEKKLLLTRIFYKRYFRNPVIFSHFLKTDPSGTPTQPHILEEGLGLINQGLKPDYTRVGCEYVILKKRKFFLTFFLGTKLRNKAYSQTRANFIYSFFKKNFPDGHLVADVMIKPLVFFSSFIGRKAAQLPSPFLKGSCFF